MPAFTTRVELHGATYTDYQTLHAAMDLEGFHRTIQGDDGFWYHLPTAEYVVSANAMGAQVLASAQRAAGKTGKASSILVTQGQSWNWSGLQRV